MKDVGTKVVTVLESGQLGKLLLFGYGLTDLVELCVNRQMSGGGGSWEAVGSRGGGHRQTG